MKKNFLLTLMLLVVALFTVQPTVAQAPSATPEEAVTALLNRIGGDGTADRFEIVIDANLAENGKDVFVITAADGKPCIKGNTQLSVATGINWYLNHYAHINLTWNNLTTDLSLVTLPVPESEDKHVCNTTYRYDFNTCTFSYSMAFWTWERWQKEIDWMALHGINAPLNLVGLDVVTRNFLKELGMSDSDIAAYIAGPGFIAWFAMNNLEGWGGTINSSSTGVDMSGNPDWWYTRQEQLCKNMLQRMRELGMQPVIPGFSGQIPNSLSNYSITGFSSGDVINGGTWAGDYTRPDILHPNSSSYATLAPIYYKHLEAIMGVSEFYSMDPFHEGGLPSAVTNATCYPPIMAALDTYHNAVDDATKTSYNVGTDDNQAKWIIQYWQNIPQSGAFSAMSSYGDRFIGLDLFSDNIYAGNAAKWRDTGDDCYYQGRPYIYCMLHNFGGRSGLHGRLETTMDGYFQALAKNNNCQGIGATPEGTETNPILYDMLFELPWMDVNNRPTADEWLEEYTYSRYGVSAETAPNALAALQNLKKSVWDCKVNQQGTSEAVILARPDWTINSVSAWSTSAIYWDTQDVRLAADQFISVADFFTDQSADGTVNYNYDVIDVIRQAMVDYAAELLPLIKAAYDSKNTDEYTRLYTLYLDLMLDLDEMLSYDENFKLERWTSLARNIADEVNGTTENDRNWLEWNARTQVTVWSKGDTDLHDYSNRCWAGLIKDFHYWRWKYFFENNGNAPSGGWFSGFEYPWTVDFNEVYSYAGDYLQVVIPTDMTATEKAAQTFGNYFGRVEGATKNYIFPMGVATNATKSDVLPEVYRGQTVKLPLIIGKEVTVSSVQIDLNGDGAMGNTETLTANGMNVTIPADAAIGKTKAIVEFSDGTVITFNIALIEDITENRTVTAATADANMGTVAIEGDDDSDGSITNMEAVKITATANTGYNFKNWTIEYADTTVISNDNPYIYYGKDAASFTANFIQDKWGVPTQTASGLSDATTNNQYVNNISFAYYMRDAESIYSVTTNGIPTSLFITVPQIIDVPQGASFTISWSDNGAQNLTKCFMSAYMDFNANGDFSEEGELVKVVGTKGADNSAVRSGSFQVLLPYDAPLGITHLRMRFDSAWGSEYNSETGAFNPKGELDRMCYEVILNITDKTDKAAHITVKTNSDEWGTAEVWTDETPDGSTGTEWDVSSNIPLYLRATKGSADTEFLGWYDHYGRLLTTELEYTMYAREDATYTAKFRRFIEIDGWQIEYRTEPGTEIKTTKLANGVKPENGKMYYIYAPTRPTNDGDYVNRYLYNNNGTLSLNTTASGDNYLWTCSVDGENYTFQNVGDPTKYLAHKAVAASPYNFTLGTGATQYEGITIYSVNDSRFLVTKDDGTGFDQSTRAHNQSTEDYTTDYVFVEVTYPNVVILTEVRKSGNHDLVIPETVNILGEDLKIVGFDNGLFTNNKDLWSISLPATIETVSSNRVFKAAISGKGADQSADTGNYITTDLGTTLAPGEDWSISLTVEDNGNNFNQWGSALIATGNAPMNSTYANGFQLYMQSTSNGGKLIVKLDADNNNNALATISKGTKYRIDIVYTHSNTQLVVTATSLETQADIAASRSAAARATNSLTLTQDMSDFSVVSHAIPEGVNITNLEVTKGAVPDPFEGCTNLVEMTVAAENASYYVDDETRTLYTRGGTDLHALASEEDAEKIRDLCELIDLADALIEEVTVSVNPTGTATAQPLTTTADSDFYVSTNADQNTGGGNSDGGGIAALVDNNENTFFHTRWGGTVVNEPHYIQVDLGAANLMDYFKFTYKPRNGSPAPTAMIVYGSNDGDNFTDVLATIDSNLPAHNSGNTYESAVIDSKRYEYLRFVVTASAGPGNAQYGGQYFFGMLEFDLYKVTSSVEVAPKYKNLAGVTNEETATVYDSMAEALYFYNNGGTADELQAAYDALKPLYDALYEKKDKILNGVYNINFGGAPLFIAYAAAKELDGLTGADYAGYRLFDATTTNTDSKHLTIQNNAIAAQAPADALFTIVPKDDYSGYHLSAQGNYMRATGVHSQWDIQAFDTDVANAGVYLFEETATADVFKLKSTINITTANATTNYVNDWGPVFGSDNSNKENLSTFTLTPVTEYTVAVPASGVTTLCLPFNVVLPAGVTAYDLTEAQIIQKGSRYIYELNNVVAAEGETLAKNTPVIIKASEGNHVFTITMSDENVKGSASGSVLRSGLVRTTIDNTVINYTFNDGTFSLVEPTADVAANQCWMELAENRGTQILDESSYSGAFFYTTDEESPVLYNIYHKRTGNVMSYNSTNDKVDILVKVDNNTYQAWYFMEGTDGAVLIKPYNGNGKVLGANDTSDGNDKLLLVADATYKNWTIESAKEYDGEQYFYIKTNGTFVNDYQNKPDSIGFWSGADASTTGSHFKFVEAEFENDNARYYQLEDLLGTMDVTTQAMSGDAPGCRENGNEHYDAYTTAASLINAGSDVSAAADCYAAYKELLETRAELGEMIMPTPGKVYRLRNHISKAAEEGHKNHYIANSNAKLAFPAEADDNTTLWICVEGADGKYQFISGVGSATLTWKNFGENAVDYGIRSGVERGAVALAYGTDNLTLTNEDNANGVRFGHIASNAIQQDNTWSTDWYIEPVADVEVCYSRSIAKGYNYATLYLPYAATVPDGISAYTAVESDVKEGDTKRYVDLQEVENGIIPARTAVVLYREGDAPELQEYKFVYTTEKGTSAVDNIFDGRVMTSAVGGDPTNNCYYLLFNGTKGEAFYWMKEEYNESLSSGSTHIKCEGNKAYMVLPKTANNASSYSFRFPDTTDIDEVVGDDGEVKGIYDLQGRKLTEITEPGIYIVNGKKQFVK